MLLLLQADGLSLTSLKLPQLHYCCSKHEKKVTVGTMLIGLFPGARLLGRRLLLKMLYRNSCCYIAQRLSNKDIILFSLAVFSLVEVFLMLHIYLHCRHSIREQYDKIQINSLLILCTLVLHHQFQITDTPGHGSQSVPILVIRRSPNTLQNSTRV